MKRYALFILSALILSAGCDVVEPLPGEPPGREAYASVRLRMQSCPAGTRSGSEDAIYDGIVLQFDKEGTLLDMVQFTGDVLPEMQVRKNQEIELYIVANPTVDLSGVTSRQDFFSTQSDYKANTSEKMEMKGYVSGIFDRDSVVSVNMERMLSKITLGAFVIKVNTASDKYTSASFQRAYMERTPVSCGYDHTPSGEYLDAYSQRISLGYYNSYPGFANKYSQGDYLVWEYNYPQSVYCYPNASESRSERNRFRVMCRLSYTYTGIDAATGETVVMSHRDESYVRLVLPPMIPNTAYELERLTINGYKGKVVYLENRRIGEEKPLTCSFRMTDMTSGKYLGTIEGEVEYEMVDS